MSCNMSVMMVLIHQNDKLHQFLMQQKMIEQEFKNFNQSDYPNQQNSTLSK